MRCASSILLLVLVLQAPSAAAVEVTVVGGMVLHGGSFAPLGGRQRFQGEQGLRVEATGDWVEHVGVAASWGVSMSPVYVSSIRVQAFGLLTEAAPLVGRSILYGGADDFTLPVTAIVNRTEGGDLTPLQGLPHVATTEQDGRPIEVRWTEEADLFVVVLDRRDWFNAHRNLEELYAKEVEYEARLAATEANVTRAMLSLSRDVGQPLPARDAEAQRDLVFRLREDLASAFAGTSRDTFRPFPPVPPAPLLQAFGARHAGVTEDYARRFSDLHARLEQLDARIQAAAEARATTDREMRDSLALLIAAAGLALTGAEAGFKLWGRSKPMRDRWRALRRPAVE